MWKTKMANGQYRRSKNGMVDTSTPGWLRDVWVSEGRSWHTGDLLPVEPAPGVEEDDGDANVKPLGYEQPEENKKQGEDAEEPERQVDRRDRRRPNGGHRRLRADDGL